VTAGRAFSCGEEVGLGEGTSRLSSKWALKYIGGSAQISWLLFYNGLGPIYDEARPSEVRLICMVYNVKQAVKLGVTLLGWFPARLLYSLQRKISTEPFGFIRNHGLPIEQLWQYYKR
jgi:hypothetical protein